MHSRTQPTALLFRSRIDSSSFRAHKKNPLTSAVGGGWSRDRPAVAVVFFSFFSFSTDGGVEVGSKSRQGLTQACFRAAAPLHGEAKLQCG